MDYVPKLAKNNLYVAIQVSCRVKVDMRPIILSVIDLKKDKKMQ